MAFNELKDLVVQLLASWEVVAVTLVVFFYFFLVNYVGRYHHKPAPSPSARPRKIKKELRKKGPTAAEKELEGGDLGIEEED
jgi:hypothetical protein